MTFMIRTTVAILFAASASMAVAGQCDTKEGARKTVTGLDASMMTLKTNQKKREASAQAEIDAITKKMVDSKRWTKEQSGTFYLEQMQSPAFSGLQKQKMDILKVYMQATESFVEQQKKKDDMKACTYASKMLDSLNAITALNDKQYAGMLEAAKKVAAK
jgi:hypothetical protein